MADLGFPMGGGGNPKWGREPIIFANSQLILNSVPLAIQVMEKVFTSDVSVNLSYDRAVRFCNLKKFGSFY